MREERVTNSNLKLPKSKREKIKRRSTQKKRKFPQDIIAASLGILFLLLLMTLRFGCLLFWRTCRSENVTCPERNATFSPESKYHHSTSPSYTDKKNPSDTCHGECSNYVKNCYYFSTKEKTWEESKKSCQDRGRRLLKIDDKEEMKFVQSKIKYSFWIGLRKDSRISWLWVDGSVLSRKLKFEPPKSIGHSLCGYIRPSRLSSYPCSEKLPYICEEISSQND